MGVMQCVPAGVLQSLTIQTCHLVQHNIHTVVGAHVHSDFDSGRYDLFRARGGARLANLMEAKSRELLQGLPEVHGATKIDTTNNYAKTYGKLPQINGKAPASPAADKYPPDNDPQSKVCTLLHGRPWRVCVTILLHQSTMYC